jgi:uncharacterized protein (TIGR02145 family)
MKNLVLFLCMIVLSSIVFGQTEMKIYKKNNQLESIPVSQVDSVKYSSSFPTTMNVYKANNTPTLSIPIADIDSIKYLSNTVSKLECDSALVDGKLMEGVEANAFAQITYVGDISGNFKNKVFTSIGVTGLNISSFIDTVINGITYVGFSLTGIPNTVGKGSFEIDLGNNKSCLLNFETIKKIEYVQDADQNMYTTVQIGDQVWLSRNIVSTKYRDHSLINKWGWATINNSYGEYDNDYHNTKYGYLYNFDAAGNVCPTGWHLPSQDEFMVLMAYLGGDGVAGGKLKEVDTTNWKSPNIASNSSLFTALPGGKRRINGSFEGIGLIGSWWTSTLRVPNDNRSAIVFSVQNASERFYWNGAPVDEGHSVRCIKDK